MTTYKYRYVLLVVDYFSRWCEAIPLQSLFHFGIMLTSLLCLWLVVTDADRGENDGTIFDRHRKSLLFQLEMHTFTHPYPN